MLPNPPSTAAANPSSITVKPKFRSTAAERREQHAGDAGERGRHAEREHRQHVDRDAAQPGGVAVGRSGAELAAELRLLEEHDERDDDDRGDDHDHAPLPLDVGAEDVDQ